VVPSRPVLPMSNLRNKDVIPEVDVNLPEKLKRHHKLFSAPEQLKNKEHRNGGADCHCAPTGFDYHALNFTQSVCMKKGKVEVEKTELKTEFTADKTEPHRRPHLYSEKSRKPVLLYPVPFLNQIPWEPKVYLPANATEPPSKRQDLFYALFDEKRYREAIKPYLSEPQTWDDIIHPFYKEPDSQDELSLWTKGTYGVESLSRVLYPCHPARYSELPIYSCMEKNWMVPILKGPFQANAIMDYLKRKLEPFYSEGKGRIVCPVCMVFTSGNEYRIVYYTRTEFKAHYEKRHQHFEGTAYQGFGTGYNIRMYEATLIYALATAYNCKSLADQRNVSPFKSGRCTHYEVYYSGHLRELLLKNGVILPPLTPKALAAAGGEPVVVELDDNDERIKPEASGSSRQPEGRPPAQARGNPHKRPESRASERTESHPPRRSRSHSPRRPTSRLAEPPTNHSPQRSASRSSQQSTNCPVKLSESRSPERPESRPTKQQKSRSPEPPMDCSPERPKSRSSKKKKKSRHSSTRRKTRSSTGHSSSTPRPEPMDTGQPTLSETEATLDDLSEAEKKEGVPEEAYHILEIDYDPRENFD
jgi:hypothetical protein